MATAFAIARPKAFVHVATTESSGVHTLHSLHLNLPCPFAECKWVLIWPWRWTHMQEPLSSLSIKGPWAYACILEATTGGGRTPRGATESRTFLLYPMLPNCIQIVWQTLPTRPQCGHFAKSAVFRTIAETTFQAGRRANT